MRSLTTQQSNVLGLTARSAWVKVEVQNSTASGFNNLTAYVANGRTLNFVKSVTWGDNVDNPGADATIVFQREILNYNLSPLMSGSYLNSSGTLVDLNRQVKLSVAVLPFGIQPIAADWVQVFYGRIYQTDFGDDTTLTATCHDMTGELMSWWIEYGFSVGSTSGTAVETVMQSILTNTISQTGYTPYLATLVTPSSPGWNILLGWQSSMSVMTALTNLAQQIGWLCRQKWDSGSAAFKLQFYDPNRSNVSPSWTFPASFVLSPSQLGVHLGDIRNVVHVTFFDANNNMAPSRWVEVDNTSVNLYGRQFMQMAEEATSQINTSTQAAAMAQGAINDLSQPKIDYTVAMPLFWPVEVADLYKFSADGVHYDSDQTLGVVSFKHTIEAGKMGTTEMQLRGKPSGGIRVWFDRENHRVRKQFGVYNQAPSSDVSAGVYPNASLSQFSQS